MSSRLCLGRLEQSYGYFSSDPFRDYYSSHTANTTAIHSVPSPAAGLVLYLFLGLSCRQRAAVSAVRAVIPRESVFLTRSRR